MPDSYDLKRFIEAQAPVYERVQCELKAGRKRSHWMWFIFPQIEGLGYSNTARKYAIANIAEAQAYLQHPVLGLRLRECTETVTAVQGRSINEIFGSPDDMKFKSSMTLFAHATEENQLFKDALEKYYGGEEDSLTVEKLSSG
jgi:uncharacterized protein (DUF1810 family)